MESVSDTQALEQDYYSEENDTKKHTIRQLLAKEGVFPVAPSSLNFFNNLYFEGIECFEKFAQQALHLDFSAYKEDGSYFKNKEIIIFAQEILRIHQKRSITAFSFSEKSIIQDFYLTLFNSLLQDNENAKELNSRIFFFSRSSVPPSLAGKTQQIRDLLSEEQQKFDIPRIIACPMENVLSNQRNAANQLLEYMNCMNPSQEPCKNQIGLLLDFEQVIIFWRENLYPKPPGEENDGKFFLRWPFHNILNFVTALTKDLMLKSKNQPSHFEDELNQDNFSSLYELFIFCKCMSHIICMKN